MVFVRLSWRPLAVGIQTRHLSQNRANVPHSGRHVLHLPAFDVADAGLRSPSIAWCCMLV